MKKITCLVPVGKGAIREEPLFYDLDVIAKDSDMDLNQ